LPRAFSGIAAIKDADDQIDTFVNFSRYLTGSGKFGEAKQFVTMIVENYQNAELLAEAA